MRSLYRITLAVVAFFLLANVAHAQQNAVAIGTTTTDQTAVLLLAGNGKQGLIIPSADLTANGANFGKPGMIVFNTVDGKVYYFDGSANAWKTVGATGSGSTYTLSYNASTKIISLISGATGTPQVDISTTTLSGDLGGTLATPTVTGIEGKPIPLLSSVSGAQYLAYDATTGTWKFQTPGSGALAAGTGISVNTAAGTSTIATTGNFGAQNLSTTGTLSAGAATVSGLTVTGASTSFNSKTYNWPNNPTLTAGTFLQTDGSGNLTWATGGSAFPVLTANQLLSNDGTTTKGFAVGGDLTLTTGASANFAIGTGKVTSTHILDGTIAGVDLASNINIATTGTLSTGAATLSSLTVPGTTTLRSNSYTWPLTSAAGSLTNDGSGNLTWAPASGTGTVTSVGLSMPTIFTVTNSPVSASGTLTASLNSAAANTFLGAPNGSAGVPSFRTLLASDIPNLSAAQITSA